MRYFRGKSRLEKMVINIIKRIMPFPKGYSKVRFGNYFIMSLNLNDELSRITMEPFGYSPEDFLEYLSSVIKYEMIWFNARKGVFEIIDPGMPLPHYSYFGKHVGDNYYFKFI